MLKAGGVLFASTNAAGWSPQAFLAAIEQAHKEEIDEAVQFALDSAFPDVSEIYRDVYEEEIAA